jgi:hypothetical protein
VLVELLAGGGAVAGDSDDHAYGLLTSACSGMLLFCSVIAMAFLWSTVWTFHMGNGWLVHCGSREGALPCMDEILSSKLCIGSMRALPEPGDGSRWFNYMWCRYCHPCWLCSVVNSKVIYI